MQAVLDLDMNTTAFLNSGSRVGHGYDGRPRRWPPLARSDGAMQRAPSISRVASQALSAYMFNLAICKLPEMSEQALFN